MSQHQPIPAVQGALLQLDAHGFVTLPGRPSGATLRWLARRRALLITGAAILALGVVMMVVGGILRSSGLWALLILIGALLAFLGASWLGIGFLHGRVMAPRLAAESSPVTIDRRGIVLRGIGPLPWSDVGPPERRRVRVKNDIGGDCTVMPLTRQGHARVNAQPGWWRHRVGPKPYLRADIPYLLLPGIEGLTEDEILHLFHASYERFAR